MKIEFDIDQRFEHIEFKLNLIQQNAKFFLEVMAENKSNTLEWIIIILILFECILMCLEMSGAGPAFFEYLYPGLKQVATPPTPVEAVEGSVGLWRLHVSLLWWKMGIF